MPVAVKKWDQRGIRGRSSKGLCLDPGQFSPDCLQGAAGVVAGPEAEEEDLEGDDGDADEEGPGDAEFLVEAEAPAVEEEGADDR